MTKRHRPSDLELAERKLAEAYALPPGPIRADLVRMWAAEVLALGGVLTSYAEPGDFWVADQPTPEQEALMRLYLRGY